MVCSFNQICVVVAVLELWLVARSMPYKIRTKN